MKAAPYAALAAALLAIAPGPALAQDAQPLDWRALTRADVQAFAKAQADSHPGPVDPENPGFRTRFETATAEALAMADQARTREDWWATLRAYTASFEDGHVSLGLGEAPPARDPSWAGFLTAFEGDDQRVVLREDPAAPPLGARLVACDGKPAAQLAAERVGRYRGRWFLESQRVRWGSQVLFDWGHRYDPRPQACDFEVDGRVQRHVLAWRSGPLSDLSPKLTASAQSFQAPIEMRRLADGAVWISMGSFSGDGEAAKALEALLVRIRSEAAAIRAAPRVVFDLRGNGGGSTWWVQQIATELWGEAFVAARQPPGGVVDWRASPENVSHLAALKASLEARNPPPIEMVEWAENARAGLAQAVAQGRPYWRQPGGGEPEPAVSAVSRMKAPVFVLADGACASACLDALDLMKGLGVTQVGRETSADTVYMEIREQRLPSGFASFSIPVKVYRGRPRGNNETYRPDHRFAGDMADTAALERWIGGLPANPAG